MKNTPVIEELVQRWTPEARLSVPVGDDTVPFLFPAFGPGTYADTTKETLEAGQRLPTGEQTAGMLDAVYTHPAIKNSKYAQEVRKTIMHDGWLWVPHLQVWTPHNLKNPGLYVMPDTQGKGISQQVTLTELEDKLSGGFTERGVRFSADGTIRFAPLTTMKSEYHDKGTLAHDGAFIANYTVAGAEQLDTVAKQFTFKPYSWLMMNVSPDNILRLAALNWNRYIDVVRLNALFDACGSSRSGYVLSVAGSSSAVGTAPKK